MARTKQAPQETTAEKVSFSCKSENGSMSVKIGGDIDHHIASQLRIALDDRICQERPHLLRIDMSAITFMDSSGLGLIMGRYSLLGRLGASLVIVKPSSPVRRMLHLAAMERFIRIEE